MLGGNLPEIYTALEPTTEDKDFQTKQGE